MTVRATWDRRGFLKTLGTSAMATLVLSEIPVGKGARAGGAGQPCAYGAGLYGSGLYTGFLPAGTPTILADKGGADLQLEWSGAPAGTLYEVWRGDQPFAPGDPGSTLLATVSGTSYVDPGALAASTDFYYYVRAVSACE
ncbi:MAG: hypothetical protein GY716_10340 [bacterium]|nr:hypothetical protein [bacterium]